MLYYYRIFGFLTASEVLLPEAEPAEETGNPDVEIRFGRLEHDITAHPKTKSPGEAWHYCFPEDGVMWFRADDMDFQVSGGNRIMIDVHRAGEGLGHLHVFVLGTAFGAIHMQRGNVPVHGAAIEGRAGAVIITGYSGSGKSAVLGSLALDGVRFLADDVSVVTTENGRPEVFSGYPQRKIACEDAVALGYGIEGLERINEDNRDKYVIRRAEEWRRETMPLAAIIELVPAEREDGEPVKPELREIRGHAALQFVMRNLYRRQFYSETGILPEIMKKILVLTSNIRTYQLVRPREGMPVSETAELIRVGCEEL